MIGPSALWTQSTVPMNVCSPNSFSERLEGTARSSTSQGSAEPQCARIEGANRELFEGKADCLTTVRFLPTRANKKRRTGKSRGAFSGMSTGLWTAGCWLARRASPTQGLHHHGPRHLNFPYFCTTSVVKKLWPADQN